jgi:hypothetical protein
MVMIWPPLLRFAVINQRRQEVDLPDPVPPTNNTRPRFSITVSNTSGSLRSSNLEYQRYCATIGLVNGGGRAPVALWLALKFLALQAVHLNRRSAPPPGLQPRR